MSKEDTILLDIEEQNSLLFKVTIEGTDPSPAKVRLVCESSDGLSYMFNGCTSTNDIVEFVIPPMTGKLKEGLCSSRLEVLVGNRYFSPQSFDIEFKKTMKVMAENVSVSSHPPQPIIRVTATPLVKPVPPPVVEQPKIQVQPPRVRPPLESQPPRRPATVAPVTPPRHRPIGPFNVKESADDGEIRSLARELVDEIMSRKSKK